MLILFFYLGLMLIFFLPILLSFILWKKNRVYALLVLSLLPLFCGLTCVYWDGYYLPFKPCRPIIYPGEKRMTEKISYTTQDSLEPVLQFFDQRLEAKPSHLVNEDGQWMKEEINDSVTLYWCTAGDINGLTGETGCIYVSPESERTRIETEFYRWEGGNWVCSVFHK